MHVHVLVCTHTHHKHTHTPHKHTHTPHMHTHSLKLYKL